MKKNLFLAAIAAAALATGCTQNEVMQDLAENNAVGFDVYAGMSTKGFVTDNTGAGDNIGIKEANVGFGVYAYYHNASSWSATSTPNFMFNQKVLWNTSKWEYNPVKYWPNTPNDKISFFAYAPYMRDAANEAVIEEVSDNDDQGKPSVKLTLPTTGNAGDMIDFVAGQKMSVTKPTSTSAVTFNLKHQTTRVSFSLKTNRAIFNGDDGLNPEATTVVVKSLDFVNTAFLYKSGVYTFETSDTDATETEHGQDGTWTNLNSYTVGFSFTDNWTKDNPQIPASGTYTGTAYAAGQGKAIKNDASNAEVTVKLLDDGNYLFLLPPNGKTGIAAGDIKMNITYDIVTKDLKLNGGHSVTSYETTVDLPATTMAQGKAYNYTLTIGLTEVDVEAAVQKWDLASGSNIDAY